MGTAINEILGVIECVHGPVQRSNFHISANVIGVIPPSFLDNEVTCFAEWHLVLEVHRRQKEIMESPCTLKVVSFIIQDSSILVLVWCSATSLNLNNVITEHPLWLMLMPSTIFHKYLNKVALRPTCKSFLAMHRSSILKYEDDKPTTNILTTKQSLDASNVGSMLHYVDPC